MAKYKVDISGINTSSLKALTNEQNLELFRKIDKRSNNERYTISKKQFIKDKSHLSQLQDKYHQRLTKKGFDLERETTLYENRIKVLKFNNNKLDRKIKN